MSLQVVMDDFNMMSDFVLNWGSWIAISYTVACHGVLPLKLTSFLHYSNKNVAVVLSPLPIYCYSGYQMACSQ